MIPNSSLQLEQITSCSAISAYFFGEYLTYSTFEKILALVTSTLYSYTAGTVLIAETSSESENSILAAFTSIIVGSNFFSLSITTD